MRKEGSCKTGGDRVEPQPVSNPRPHESSPPSGQRAAVVGLWAVAALAWLLPEGYKLLFRTHAKPIPVVYESRERGRLAWSPPRALEAPESRQGRVLNSDGTPGPPVGGWAGLLLGNPLDLNTATVEDLEALPGVGPKLAGVIAETRAKLGSFRDVEDLLAVPGVGPKTLERLRPFVRAGRAGAM